MPTIKSSTQEGPLPDVTVLMTVYNGGPYLEKAIQSILDQTFSEFELLIIDNASTDGSREAVERFQDARIRLLANTINLGPAGALNLGLRAAKGRYIARMDADDVALPNRLERQLAFMRRRPEVAAVGTQVRMIDRHGRVLYEPDLPTQYPELMWKLMFTSPVMHASVMFRRDIVLELGGYEERIRYTPDYDLWSRIMAHGHVVTNLSEPLALIRIHPNSDGPKAVQSQLIEDVTTISARNIEGFLHLPVSKESVRHMILMVNYLQCEKSGVVDAVCTLDAVARACVTTYGPEVTPCYSRTLVRVGILHGKIPPLKRACLILKGLGVQLRALGWLELLRSVRNWVISGRVAGVVRLARYRSALKGTTRA